MYKFIYLWRALWWLSCKSLSQWLKITRLRGYSLIANYQVYRNVKTFPLLLQTTTQKRKNVIAFDKVIWKRELSVSDKLSGKRKYYGTKEKEERKRRRDLASSRLTNCKYLNCGCRMTLINIANGTECRRRDEEVRPSAVQDRKETVVGYARRWEGRRKRKRKRGWRVLWVFIISPSRLDSVKLWNNPLMSPPCRVDRMPTKLSDFSLFCSPRFLSLGLSSPRRSLAASFHFPIAFSYASFHFSGINRSPRVSQPFSLLELDRRCDHDYCKTRVALWLRFNRVSHGWFLQRGNKWKSLIGVYSSCFRSNLGTIENFQRKWRRFNFAQRPMSNWKIPFLSETFSSIVLQTAIN